MGPLLRVLLTALALWGTGCSWLWPTVVPTSPKEPLFHSSFPLAGPLRLDGALCSLASLGPDATRAVSRPESMYGAVPLEEACRGGGAGGGRHESGPRLVVVGTGRGPVYGYLFAAHPATGLLVAFSGLGLPAAGWVNQRFAEVAARRGLSTFAPVRDESPRPIFFDPLREALRATEAARQVIAACGVGAPADLRFVGISLGGLEALLANRESLRQGDATRAAVLDPVLDVQLASANLDSFWHGLAVDTVQGFFRRILAGRYGEDPPPGFQEVMSRTDPRKGALSDLRADSPSAWLCAAPREPYAVFLSDTDPVLGDDQRGFAERCKFPLERARVPGHTPLACRLELFDEMVERLCRPERVAAVTVSVAAGSRRDPLAPRNAVMFRPCREKSAPPSAAAAWSSCTGAATSSPSSSASRRSG